MYVLKNVSFMTTEIKFESETISNTKNDFELKTRSVKPKV